MILQNFNEKMRSRLLNLFASGSGNAMDVTNGHGQLSMNN